MRVLHVSQPVEAGVPAVMLNIARHQRAAGHDVVIACPPDAALIASAAAADVRVVPWAATRAPGVALALETAGMSRIVRAEAPDIVHLHSAKAGLAGRLAIRGRRPTVFQPHAWSFLAATGITAQLARRWEVVGARWTTHLIAVSQAEHDAGAALGVRGPATVVPNGVDTERFAPHPPADRSAARAGLGLGEAPLAVCVGRLCIQKGQDVLVAAWAEVRRAVPDAELVLVGGGDPAALVAPGVRAVGARADVEAFYAAADLVVAPSRWEGLSLALLEAMACGASIVATDVAGVREALAPDGGAVVPVADAGALAAAITERLGDPPRRVAEGAANRARSLAAFDLRRCLAGIDAVYAELLGRRPA